MQFSENWLRTLINPKLNAQELADLLTTSGLEVEDLQEVSIPFSNVVIAEVQAIEQHPFADRLKVCQVNTGSEKLTIVCGAENVIVGMKVPCARIGATLAAHGITIKKTTIRNIESFGMLCSSQELSLPQETKGLLELPQSAILGMALEDYFHLANDTIFIVKPTPNRGDCLSILGIAREISSIIRQSFIDIPPQEPPTTSIDTPYVTVNFSIACPYYTGRRINLQNPQIETPAWIKDRLQKSGIQSHSIVIDVTNYVMLLTGQPLHAFDSNKIFGDIKVRQAHKGEKLALLNGQIIELQEGHLVIADNNEPIALAGIMGGESTKVSTNTQHIFLESAEFTPEIIRKASQSYNILSDSAYRFERGIDRTSTAKALDLATNILLDICGGEAGIMIKTGSELLEIQKIEIRQQQIEDLLGIQLSSDIIIDILQRLNISIQHEENILILTPPSYRFDLKIAEDIIEEIARIYGYNNIPAILPASIVPTSISSTQQFSRFTQKMKEKLSAQGYQEIISYSFVDENLERQFLGNSDPIYLNNPMTQKMNVMRSSLWIGLIEGLVYNLNRQQTDIRLFEIGKTYHLQELTKLSGLIYGKKVPRQWGEPAKLIDFFDVKGDLLEILPASAEFTANTHPVLHPKQSAEIFLQNKSIGWIGKLHPKWQKHFEITDSVFLFELCLSALMLSSINKLQAISKHLPAQRDLALVVKEEIESEKLRQCLMQAKIPNISSIDLFDVYRGQPLPTGHKSLAFAISLQDETKTLTDSEIDTAMENLLAIAKKHFNATLR